MTDKINVRGINFSNVGFDDAVDLLIKRIDDRLQTALYTPNSEIVQNCIDNPELFPVINSGDVIVPDGIGVVKAAKILGTPFKGGKVAGIEVGEAMFARLNGTDKKIFFLGGKPGVADSARDNLRKKYPTLNIVGCADGYFKKTGEESDAVVAMINEANPDVVYVCLGAPAQEKWIFENRAKMPGVMLFLGLGGSLDGYAGNVKRAPKIFIDLGLEWFYRLLCDPKRIGRMMKLPKFYFGTLWYKWTKK